MGDLAIRIVIATCRWPVKARSPVKESDKNHSEALAWQTAGRGGGGGGQRPAPPPRRPAATLLPRPHRLPGPPRGRRRWP
jgi:hypothetical protein